MATAKIEAKGEAADGRDVGKDYELVAGLAKTEEAAGLAKERSVLLLWFRSGWLSRSGSAWH